MLDFRVGSADIFGVRRHVSNVPLHRKSRLTTLNITATPRLRSVTGESLLPNCGVQESVKLRWLPDDQKVAIIIFGDRPYGRSFFFGMQVD